MACRQEKIPRHSFVYDTDSWISTRYIVRAIVALTDLDADMFVGTQVRAFLGIDTLANANDRQFARPSIRDELFHSFLFLFSPRLHLSFSVLHETPS
jgi:hypothetical protein